MHTWCHLAFRSLDLGARINNSLWISLVGEAVYVRTAPVQPDAGNNGMYSTNRDQRACKRSSRCDVQRVIMRHCPMRAGSREASEQARHLCEATAAARAGRGCSPAVRGGTVLARQPPGTAPLGWSSRPANRRGGLIKTFACFGAGIPPSPRWSCTRDTVSCVCSQNAVRRETGDTTYRRNTLYDTRNTGSALTNDRGCSRRALVEAPPE